MTIWLPQFAEPVSKSNMCLKVGKPSNYYKGMCWGLVALKSIEGGDYMLNQGLEYLGGRAEAGMSITNQKFKINCCKYLLS